MRVLVLGETGFTGRHLTERLRQDAGVEVLPSRAFGLDLRSANSIEAAVRECHPNVVVNLAAISSPAENDHRLIYQVNAFAVETLLQALKRTGFAGRLVQASSANIYGNRSAAMIEETDPPEPVNHYACSKYLAERFCAMAAAEFEIVLTRPFSCIGVGQKPNFLLPKIVRHFQAKAPMLELGNIGVRRDFIDIRDVAAVYHRLICAATVPGMLHICRNETHSIEEIIQALSRISRHSLEIRVNPAFVRANDLLFQQGSDAGMRTLGLSCVYGLEDTLRWMYKTQKD
jgi:nucleoside-diphosphate-sugar epimerase